jgi:1,4-alpha-glucan branching enzyme
MKCDKYGVWQIFLPDAKYASRLTHGSRVKVHVVSDSGTLDRIPAYIRRVVQDEDSKDYSGVYWDLKPYAWKHERPPLTSVATTDLARFDST